MKRLFFFLLAFLLACSAVWAQGSRVKVKIQLTDTAGNKLQGKNTLAILETDSDIKTYKTSGNGIFSLNLQTNKKYVISLDRDDAVTSEIHFNTYLPDESFLIFSPQHVYKLKVLTGGLAVQYKNEKTRIEYSPDAKNYKPVSPVSFLFNDLSDYRSRLQMFNNDFFTLDSNFLSFSNMPDETEISQSTPEKPDKQKIKIAVKQIHDSIKVETNKIIQHIKTQISSKKDSSHPEHPQFVYEVMSSKFDSIMDAKPIVLNEININVPEIRQIECAYKDLNSQKEKILSAQQFLDEARENCVTREDSLEIEVRELKLRDEEKGLLLIEQQLETAKKQLLVQNAKLKGQRVIIYSSLVSITVLLISLILVYILFHSKKKANVLLARQNSEIQQKNEEITAQRDEIEAQRNMLGEQKRKIEDILSSLTDSIQYAERIQNAILPDKSILSGIFPENFIIDIPRDVVSGDFYFFRKIKNYLLILVADSTGHGVPGAFMSMLGIAFLNELAEKQKDVEKPNPAELLDSLRQKITDALRQSGNEAGQQDGMDISLIAINTTPQAQTSEGSKLPEVLRVYSAQWAGANNPLWIVRKLKAERYKEESELDKLSTFELYELKGDKMPVGIYTRMDHFTLHDIELYPGDRIYLFSDGFADQHGGHKGKKIKSGKFRDLLLETALLPMPDQEQRLTDYLNNWKDSIDKFTQKSFEQTDDICILGIQI